MHAMKSHVVKLHNTLSGLMTVALSLEMRKVASKEMYWLDLGNTIKKTESQLSKF